METVQDLNGRPIRRRLPQFKRQLVSIWTQGVGEMRLNKCCWLLEQNVNWLLEQSGTIKQNTNILHNEGHDAYCTTLWPNSMTCSERLIGYKNQCYSNRKVETQPGLEKWPPTLKETSKCEDSYLQLPSPPSLPFHGPSHTFPEQSSHLLLSPNPWVQMLTNCPLNCDSCLLMSLALIHLTQFPICF